MKFVLVVLIVSISQYFLLTLWASLLSNVVVANPYSYFYEGGGGGDTSYDLLYVYPIVATVAFSIYVSDGFWPFVRTAFEAVFVQLILQFLLFVMGSGFRLELSNALFLVGFAQILLFPRTVILLSLLTLVAPLFYGVKRQGLGRAAK